MLVRQVKRWDSRGSGKGWVGGCYGRKCWRRKGWNSNGKNTQIRKEYCGILKLALSFSWLLPGSNIEASPQAVWCFKTVVSSLAEMSHAVSPPQVARAPTLSVSFLSTLFLQWVCTGGHDYIVDFFGGYFRTLKNLAWVQQLSSSPDFPCTSCCNTVLHSPSNPFQVCISCTYFKSGLKMTVFLFACPLKLQFHRMVISCGWFTLPLKLNSVVGWPEALLFLEMKSFWDAKHSVRKLGKSRTNQDSWHLKFLCSCYSPLSSSRVPTTWYSLNISNKYYQ